MAQNKKSATVKADLIITTQSERIEAFITEVSDETISYRKASNPKGPVFVLNTDKISSILYANGEVQVIKHQAKAQPQTSASSSMMVHSPAPMDLEDAPFINTRAQRPIVQTQKEENTPEKTSPYLSGTAHVRGMVGGLGEGQQTVGGIGGDVEIGFVTSDDINFLGVGIAIDALFGKLLGENTTVLYMPMYACDRIYFTSSKNAPYLDLALGGFVNIKREIGLESEKLKGGGLYFRPGLGFAINTKTPLIVHLNVGYELRYSKVEGIENKEHAIFFRVGFGGR